MNQTSPSTVPHLDGPAKQKLLSQLQTAMATSIAGGSGPKSLPMLDTCAELLTAPKSEHLVYVVELGGSTARAYRVKIGPEVASETSKRIAMHTSAAFKDANNPASALFDALSDVLRELLAEAGEQENEMNLACIFSFALEQTSIERGTVLMAGKDFNTGSKTDDPLVGTDVKMALEAALSRQGLKGNVRVVTNDSVGTLASADFQGRYHGGCRVGIIVGTGVNVCYADPMAHSCGYVGSLMNTEVGCYTENLPACPLDEQLATRQGVTQFSGFERMTGGLYLGELCRLAVLSIMGDKAPEGCRKEHSLGCDDATKLWLGDLAASREVFQRCFDYPELTEETHSAVQADARAIFERSASLMAVAGASGLIRSAVQSPPETVITVAFAGSVIQLCNEYRQLVQSQITELAPQIKVHFEVVSDAAAIGGAWLTASLLEAKK